MIFMIMFGIAIWKLIDTTSVRKLLFIWKFWMGIISFDDSTRMRPDLPYLFRSRKCTVRTFENSSRENILCN